MFDPNTTMKIVAAAAFGAACISAILQLARWAPAALDDEYAAAVEQSDAAADFDKMIAKQLEEAEVQAAWDRLTPAQQAQVIRDYDEATDAGDLPVYAPYVEQWLAVVFERSVGANR